ncbi:MAG: hypothetical protein ACE5LA_03650 [Dehalococcoidales bacterium]
MELSQILFIVVVVLVVGGILFRYLVWDRMKGHPDIKKSGEGEMNEKT